MKNNVMQEELKVNGGNLTENDKEEIKSLLKVKKKLKEKEPEERLGKAIKFMEKWGEEPDYDMAKEMKEYKEFQELLNILKGGVNNGR